MLEAQACNLTKSITPPWAFSHFLNCTNGTKLRKAIKIKSFYDNREKSDEFISI